MATCCAILATAVVRGLSADTSQSSWKVPSDAQVIGYLLQSVNWYRHVYTERQVASDPGDLVSLNGNQAIEGQIVKLSFEFAKADAALAKDGHFSARRWRLDETWQANFCGKARLPEDLVLYCGRHDYGARVLSNTRNLAAVMEDDGAQGCKNRHAVPAS
jgi:hypothetical protein